MPSATQLTGTRGCEPDVSLCCTCPSLAPKAAQAMPWGTARPMWRQTSALADVCLVVHLCLWQPQLQKAVGFAAARAEAVGALLCTEGAPDDVQRVSYLWALQQDAAGFVATDGKVYPPRWQVRDCLLPSAGLLY